MTVQGFCSFTSIGPIHHSTDARLKYLPKRHVGSGSRKKAGIRPRSSGFAAHHEATVSGPVYSYIVKYANYLYDPLQDIELCNRQVLEDEMKIKCWCSASFFICCRTFLFSLLFIVAAAVFLLVYNTFNFISPFSTGQFFSRLPPGFFLHWCAEAFQYLWFGH